MTSFSFKVFRIVIGTLAKPMVSYVTHFGKNNLQKKQTRFSRLISYLFIGLGQRTHYYNTKLNNKIFNLSRNSEIKPLSDTQALEKGAELFSEIIIYAIIITLPTLEIIRQYKLSQIKEQKKEEDLQNLKKKIDTLSEENLGIKKRIELAKYKLKEIKNMKFEAAIGS